MSDEEEDETNNKILEEEEENEEEDDIEDISKNSKIEFSNSENEEENEYNEKTSKDNINRKNKNNDSKKKSKKEYIAILEHLQNELKLEKKINNKLKNEDESYYEEIKNLKNELEKKNNNLERLLISNKKQKSSLNLLRNQLNDFNNKKKEIKENKKENNSESVMEKQNQLKIIDKEIYKSIKKMNYLKNENDNMKSILFKITESKEYINLDNKKKQINNKIEYNINEKNILTKQLEYHNKICLQEQKEFINEYNNLKIKLNEIKRQIRNVNLKTKKINDNFYRNFNESSILVKRNSMKLYFKENKFCSSSTPNIRSSRNKIINSKDKIKELPVINPHLNLIKKEEIIDDNFKKKIKEFLDGNEDEYMTLINKINSFVNNKKIMENEHNIKIKKYNLRIISLDEKCKYLNSNSKGINNIIRVLKYKFNIINGNNKQLLKKFNEYKKELKLKENLMKQKNDNINLLVEEINKIKDLVRQEEVESTNDDIINHIKNLKKEKGIGYDEESENNINDEDIQADFTDSENYNEFI